MRGDDYKSHDRKHICGQGIGFIFLTTHLWAAKNCAHTVVVGRGVARCGCSWKFYLGMMTRTRAYLHPVAGQAHIEDSFTYTATTSRFYALSGWNLDHGTYDVFNDGSDEWQHTSKTGPYDGPRHYFTHYPLAAAFNKHFWRLVVICKNCDLKQNATPVQVNNMNQLAAGSTWI